MKKKEIFWLTGIILFVIVFFFCPSGFTNFDLTSGTDINSSDNYDSETGTLNGGSGN